ncbi:hypothetical protein THAOC_34469 [Thalassiosira oceanica]|uniref:Uncharacterized protein n=1 Tax=Thalassiosira oceanica TaxID=159749 RepID=K0RJI9_THAOC|nr:hypothetical protein THAOC_34469 [Thalassiosira oceanica]|eukprot:EJK46847.1 hypothetical protein THAOC_34469 [Thalassiosira oceanica]
MSPLQVSDLGEVSNDGKIRVVTERDNLLVDHKSKDTEHGGTAVVELDGTLLELGLLVKLIPAEVDVAVAEVSDELVSGSRNITHEAALEEANQGDDLNEASGRDGVRADEGGDTVGERVEGVSGVVDVSAKVESATGGDLSKEGKHSDTSVLDLDCEKERERRENALAREKERWIVPCNVNPLTVTEAVESLLGAVAVQHTKRIVESKRRLGTELILEGVELSGGLAGLGRGKGGGGADEGEGGDRLHDFHEGRTSEAFSGPWGPLSAGGLGQAAPDL